MFFISTSALKITASIVFSFMYNSRVAWKFLSYVDFHWDMQFHENQKIFQDSVNASIFLIIIIVFNMKDPCFSFDDVNGVYHKYKINWFI